MPMMPQRKQLVRGLEKMGFWPQKEDGEEDGRERFDEIWEELDGRERLAVLWIAAALVSR